MITFIIITYLFLTIWVFYQLFIYFYWPKVKAWILHQIDILEAERVHRANQQKNKLKELERSKVVEVEIEEVNEPLEWRYIKYNESKTKGFILDITNKKPHSIE